MKKSQRRILLMLAVLGGLSCSVTAFADWRSENGKYYYEENGSRVYNTWKKSGNDQKWRYLGSDSYMATNTWVLDGDSKYYVDQNGVMVSSNWIKDLENGETHWYYALDSGKLVQDKWLQLNGKYYFFDPDGRMQTGWLEDGNYYCDPADGARVSGWRELEVPDEFSSYEESSFSEGKAWFFFDEQSGRKYAARDDGFVQRSINGKNYAFNADGIMQTGWVKFRDTSPEIAGYRYYAKKNNAGFTLGQAIANTWYALYAPEDKDGYDSNWYYFTSAGFPKAPAADGQYSIMRIGNKRYMFNDKGNPVYGIVHVPNQRAEDGFDCYYYGTSKQNCSAVSGRVTFEDGNGERVTGWFSDAGLGFSGPKSGYLYYKGRLQKADTDLRYVIVEVEGKPYVINSAGVILKNKKNLTDGNGNKVNISASGAVSSVDGMLSTQEAVAPGRTDNN